MFERRKNRLHRSRLRCGCLVALLALFLPVSTLWSQTSKTVGRNERIFEVEDLDPAEGERLLHTLRNQHPAGDFIFRFQLEHFPEIGETTTYEGLLWGTWIDGAQVFRIHLGGGGASPGEIAYRFLIRSGPDGFIYRLAEPSADDPGDPEPVQLTGPDRFEPLMPGLTYTPFDLQLPFLYWEDLRYRGTDRVIGRPAYRFLAVAPEDSAVGETRPLAGISLAVDADFYALLRADYLDPDGETLRSLRLLNFKKVQDQWIVRRLDVKNSETREKTRFNVRAAAMGLNLPKKEFVPAALSAPATLPGSERFDYLF
ncbi:MAG: outer membrane lipoprotein-sorting protein [Opitutales bacterium]